MNRPARHKKTARRNRAAKTFFQGQLRLGFYPKDWDRFFRINWMIVFPDVWIWLLRWILGLNWFCLDLDSVIGSQRIDREHYVFSKELMNAGAFVVVS
jgi:hypothetical protein